VSHDGEQPTDAHDEAVDEQDGAGFSDGDASEENATDLDTSYDGVPRRPLRQEEHDGGQCTRCGQAHERGRPCRGGGPSRPRRTRDEKQTKPDRSSPQATTQNGQPDVQGAASGSETPSAPRTSEGSSAPGAEVRDGPSRPSLTSSTGGGAGDAARNSSGGGNSGKGGPTGGAGAAGAAGSKAAEGAAGAAGSKAAEGAAGAAGSKAAEGAAGAASGKAAGGVSAYKDDALQAKEAVQNRDATGATDAAVRAGLKAGAESVAPGVGGAVASTALDTEVGRKVSRGISKGVILAVAVPVTIFALLLGVMGMSVITLFGGAAGTVAAAMGESLDACEVEGGSGSGTGGSDVAEPADTEKARAQAVWDVLTDAGLSDEAAAGVLGNLDQESNIDPTAVQADGPGMGLAQWSRGGRWDTGPNSFLAFVKKRNLDKDSVVAQADFIIFEMKKVISDFNFAKFARSTDVVEATVYFHDVYERSRDDETKVRDVRGGYAQDWYDEFASGTSTQPVSSTPQDRIFVVGDSLTVGAKKSIRSELSDVGKVTIDAKNGRSTTAGADILASSSAAQNADAWVVALGTNDYRNERQFQQAARTIVAEADGRPVTWVNIYLKKAPKQSARINAVLDAVVEDTPTVTVEDFATWATSNKRLFASDGIHLTAEGYQQRGQFYAVATGSSGGGSGGSGSGADCGDPVDAGGACEPYTRELKQRFARNSGQQFDAMVPDARFTLECVASRFGARDWEPLTYVGHKPSVRHSVDYMTPGWPNGKIGCVYPSDTGAKGKAYDAGNELASQIIQNRKALGVEYVIWQDRIWSPSRNLDPALPPQEWPIDYGNQGGCTTEHYDHLHVATYGNEAEGFPEGNWIAPVGKGTWGGKPYCRLHPILGIWRPHNGWDSRGVGAGYPIKAASSGTVTVAGFTDGYGNVVHIKHGNGMETRYAHMLAITAKKGASVKTGEVIGKVGSTGLSTGAHLHFELRSAKGVVLDAKPLIENGRVATPNFQGC